MHLCVFYYFFLTMLLGLRFAAAEASVNAVLAIACQDGAVKRAIAKKRTAHAYRATAKPWRFAADAVTAFAVAVIVTKRTTSDTLDSIAKSVP